MKKQLILLFSFLFLGMSSMQVFAQNNKKEKGDRKARLAQLHRQHITEQLALSSTDSVAFWDVYGKFEVERKDIRKEIHKIEKGLIAKSDQELSQEFKQLFELKEKEITLEKTYVEALQKVISIRQVAVLMNAEKEMRREVLQRMSMQGKPGQRKGGGRK